MVDDSGAQVEALGAHAEQPIERRRQHVLAGVLLHVIEAARPVDLAVHDLAGASAVPDDDVHDRAVVAIDHVDDAAPPSVPVSNGWPPDVG